MTQIQSVKLAKLALSPINVRKQGDDLLEQLAADIAARGVLQNLIVAPVKKKRGSFEVIAGSRRFRALMILAERGDFKAIDYDVPVLVIDADESTLSETSLSENFQHLPMSPADECRAFQHFIGDEGDIDGVAARFGLTRRFVEGRLRLAALAPPIFEALETGKIGFELAKAYASTESHERQMLVWNQYGGHSGYGPETIKRVIANESMKSNEPVAVLIGAEAYLAAGGRIDRDLFTENADRWANPEIAHKLADEMMAAEAARLAGELGVAWVRPIASNNTWELARSLHRVHLPTVPMSDQEKARLAEIEARIAAIEEELQDDSMAEDAFAALEAEYTTLDEERTALHDRPSTLPDELKAHVGAILSLNHAGEMVLEERYYSEMPLRITPITEDDAESAAADRDAEDIDSDGAEAGDDDEVTGTERKITGWQIDTVLASPQPGRDAPEPNGAAPSGKALTQVHFDQLAIQRRDVLAAELLGNPALALDYMLFSMIDGRAYHCDGKSGSTISASRASDPVQAENMPASRARDYIETYAEALDDGWRDAGSKVGRFEAFRALGDEVKAQWLAWAVATSLEAKDEYGMPRQNAVQNRLATILGIDVTSWWRPTATNYFDRVSKGSILTLLDEIGGPALSARHASQKKGIIAADCEKLFAGDTIVEAEVKAVAIAWLPDAMRFLDKPEEAAAADYDDLEDQDLEAADGDDGDDMDLALNDDEAEPDEDCGPGIPIDNEDSFEADRDDGEDFLGADDMEAIAAE